MKLKPIALTVVSLTGVLCWFVGDCDQADLDLSTFYARMLSADFSGARRSIDDAIRLWPANPRYYDWRGYVASQNLPPICPRSNAEPFKVADHEAAKEAIDDYRHSLQLNKRDAVAWHNLAWLEHLFGDDKAASADLQRAIANDPANPAFHLSHGMFLEEAGDAQKAEEEYATAIEISPSILDSPFFVRYKARSKAAADSLVDRMIGKLERVLQKESDPILEARLGKLYLFQGSLSPAGNLLENASRQLPNLPLVWVNLGMVYEGQNQWIKAIDCYQKAKAIDGFIAEQYLRLGEIELRNGQKSEAANDFTRAIQRWQWVTPITAAHNNRLYVGPPQRIDDLLPTTLVRGYTDTLFGKLA